MEVSWNSHWPLCGYIYANTKQLMRWRAGEPGQWFKARSCTFKSQMLKQEEIFVFLTLSPCLRTHNCYGLSFLDSVAALRVGSLGQHSRAPQLQQELTRQPPQQCLLHWCVQQVLLSSARSLTAGRLCVVHPFSDFIATVIV